VETERKSANPMLPLDIFSRQFSAANLVTFVVYAALSGVFFLLVAFLQISMGYSAIAAGAASLPVTVLMLFLAGRSGELAQRIGPRLPLAVGPLIIAAGLLLMTQIEPGDGYLTSVFPAVVVFGFGLVLVVSPVTATVLAAAPERRSGIASGVNNAVSRVASLLAIAVLPVIAGLTGHRFYVPHLMTHGFHVAMLACAGLAVAGGVLAWLTIDNDVLKVDAAPAADGQAPVREFSCPVAGPPVRPAPEQVTDRLEPEDRDRLAAR
jgi:MFS family permease